MRSRDDVKTMKKIAEVRAIQRQTAELRAATAAELERKLDSQRSDAVARLTDDEGRWSASLSSSSLNLHVLGAWAAAIRTGQADLRHLDSRIREASDQGDRLRADWRKAIACSDTAKAMARKALIRRERRREEAALADFADLPTRRGTPS